MKSTGWNVLDVESDTSRAMRDRGSLLNKLVYSCVIAIVVLVVVLVLVNLFKRGFMARYTHHFLLEITP